MQLNPASGLKTPKLALRLPKTVPIDTLQAILLKPLCPDRFEIARAQIVVELLYFTGLRVSEAVSLRWVNSSRDQPLQTNWLCLKRQEIHVEGKGSKQRIVPLANVFVERLKLWHNYVTLFFVQQNHWARDAVLLTHKGKALTARQAQHDLTRLEHYFSMGCHLHPHMLRHSFGSHLLQESQNLRAVQELLGHRSLSSTQVYTALDFKHLAAVYDTAFPRSKK